MKQHYQISVERLEAAADTPVLRFPAQSHDDLFAVVERSHKLAELSTQESTALAIGLKLIGEVVLEHRREALFSEFYSHLGLFIKQLKART